MKINLQDYVFIIAVYNNKKIQQNMPTIKKLFNKKINAKLKRWQKIIKM